MFGPGGGWRYCDPMGQRAAGGKSVVTVGGFPYRVRVLTWRPLEETDLPALTRVAGRVLATDGGLPTAGTAGFLRRRYLAEHGSTSAWHGADLVAAAAVRTGIDGALVGTGLVDPDWRGRGLGGAVLRWLLAQPAGTVETESATAGADALLRGHGLRPVFAEDVLRIDLSTPPPVPVLPPDITLASWTPERAERFFRVYSAAFRDRPGFPGWPAPKWIAWISEDDDFAPEWTVLATRNGVDVGFVACARGTAELPDPWIVQLGVVPDARGGGLGAVLTAAALAQMAGAGATGALLDVNANNPGAAGLYHRLGFTVIGRRARYQTDESS